MKILIATDGSDYSRAAIEKCCQMFESSPDAEIEIICVYELVLPTSQPFVLSAEYIQQMDDESQVRAKETAARAAARIREKCPALANKTITKVVGGISGQRIIEEAENWKADLIVTGSHGYGFWKRAWLGSVSNSVVHNAPCSVLIVRDTDESESVAGA